MNENDIVTTDGSGAVRPDVVVVNVSPSARAAVIRSRIASITHLPVQHAHDHSVAISIVLARLGAMTIMPDEFAEFTEEARTAVDTTRSALEALRDAKRTREAMEREREIEERAEAKVRASNAAQDRQRHGAMNVIRSLQQQAATTGSAVELQAAIDAVAAQSITEEDFGMAASMVKMAQGMALDKLRLRYEHTEVAEMGNRMQLALNEEFGTTISDDPVALTVMNNKLLTIIAYTYQILGASGAPAHILDVLCDPEGATDEQVEALLPYQPDTEARELAIAETVRRSCLHHVYDAQERDAIVNLDLRAIIATVKEQQ